MLRNPAALNIERFKGLNSYAKPESVKPDWWTDAMNVIVSGKGSAEVLRSPRAVNASVGVGNPILSLADYFSTSTHKLFFDIKVDSTHMSTYTISDDLTNYAVRTGQQIAAFISLVVNGKLFRLNKYEIIQFMENATTHYRVGIDPPAAAPTIAYDTSPESDHSTSSAADDGADDIESGIQISYAYYNSTTEHCSRPSPISNRLGHGGDAIDVPVVASTEPGVDKMVFFATLDAGDIPYLLIDASGDLITKTNASTTYDFNVKDLHYDTLTPEPVYNYVPPLGAQFMFSWKDRVFLIDFIPGSDVDKATAAYSGFESTYIGQPGESWPILNRLSIPNKGETLKGGIGTQLGALFLSDTDAYLLSGYPADKTQGPEASTTVTEHMDSLHWNIGTRSARSIKATPFGTIWLDQAKRLRKWNGESFPVEIGTPLRNELDKLDSSKFDSIEGAWYQMGKNGGFYVLTGALENSAGQRMFLISIYEDPETGEKSVGYGISSIQAYTLQPIRIVNDIRMLFGGIDRTFTILDSQQAGNGWANGTEIYFEHVIGNDGNFRYWHSLRFDAGYFGTTGVTISVRDFGEDQWQARTISVDQDTDTGQSFFGMIDEEGRRKIIRFAFDTNDGAYTEGVAAEAKTDPKEIKNLQLVYKNKKRVI